MAITTISNMITVQNPPPELEAWCKKELVVPNPEYATKVRLGFWLGNTPQNLCLYEKNGTSLILPYGTLNDIWPMIYNGKVTTAFPRAARIDYGSTPVPLYDYQQEAVTALHEAKFGILQSPAGSGKTQIAIALIKEYGRRTLWLTHTTDLLKQSYDRAAQYIDPALLGTITAGKVNIGRGVTFATVQTMCNLDLDLYANEWDLVIVDECHRVAGSPTKVTQFSKVLNHLKARHKYGLSATIHRSDGLVNCTYALLGRIAHHITEETVASKIMHVAVRPCYTGVPISDECLNSDGTLYFTGMINYLSQCSMRNRQIAGDIISEKDHPCLILSDRLDHLKTLMMLLPEDMRQNAAMISGQMVSKADKALRNEILDAMREGRMKYLFASYSLAKEGLDIPCLERLFMATPIKDETVVIQSIGRIARVHPGKEQPIAYDYIDYIPFCKNAFTQRQKHYKKIGAYLI